VSETVEFTFPLQGEVFIKGSDVRGKVLGQMHDRNGRHYEIAFELMGKPVRKWFDESHLTQAQ
jgi:hypothetical protein